MLKNKASCTIKFKSAGVVALWNNEVCGQLSDGHWENAGPGGHWRFWCDARIEHDPTIEGDFLVVNKGMGPKRNTYGIVRLMNLKWDGCGGNEGYILRDRMLAYARMAHAIDQIKFADLRSEERINWYCNKAEHLPTTKTAYIEALAKAPSPHAWENEWREFPIELVNAYHNECAEYDAKQMKKDLTIISAMMKSVSKW